MKKKIAIISAVLALVLVLSLALVACNAYKWDSIGGGEPNAKVESNGGYAVKQGKYLYYINGYDGTDSPVDKQNILRSEVTVDADGKWTIDNKTTQVVVPLPVLYSSSVKDGGFAIYGEWIYYATPNYDKDKTGTPSSTDIDFMRTKIDRSVTQKIAKISGRDTRYLFTPTRILYVSGTSVNYIDFTGMKTNKSIDNGKGATSGTLIENVSGTVLWSMDMDRIFYVQTVTDVENSFKPYNELCSVKWDGSDKKVIATESTFLTGDEKPEDKVLKVFKYTLVNMLVEENDVTLYYTKTHRSGSSDTSDGFFCSKISVGSSEEATQTQFTTNEYRMTTQSVTSVYPLGYEEGALLTISSNVYKLEKDFEGEYKNRIIINSAATVCYADKTAKQVYYTSGTGLSHMSYEALDNIVTVFDEGIKTDWLNLDLIGTNLFFFATDDSNYLHFTDIMSPILGQKDEDGEQIKTPYVGIYRDEDDEDAE